MEFTYEDGWRVETKVNKPYGIIARIFNSKGKMVAKRNYPLEEEEHWIAELMYVEFVL